MSHPTKDLESGEESKPKDPENPLTWIMVYIDRHFIQHLPKSIRLPLVIALLAIVGVGALFWYFPEHFKRWFWQTPPAPEKYYGYMSNIDGDGKQYTLEEVVELTKSPAENSWRLSGSATADVKRRRGNVNAAMRWELDGYYVENTIAMTYRPQPGSGRYSIGVYYLQHRADGSWVGSVGYQHHTTRHYLANYVLIPQVQGKAKPDINDILADYPQLQKKPVDITPPLPPVDSLPQ